MNTLEQEWVDHRDDCFPDGLPAARELELRRSFYAGALRILGLLEETPKEHLASHFKKIRKETVLECDKAIARTKPRK